ncbi:hypothetical protein LZC95_22730 [Pendulispora brunnea]|uniref:Uncharacterized protein n=1 Tax=Pendulispora brunnea TaxID=2905690 RepID=A0ABZ2KLT3_9BACT
MSADFKNFPTSVFDGQQINFDVEFDPTPAKPGAKYTFLWALVPKPDNTEVPTTPSPIILPQELRLESSGSKLIASFSWRVESRNSDNRLGVSIFEDGKPLIGTIQDFKTLTASIPQVAGEAFNEVTAQANKNGAFPVALQSGPGPVTALSDEGLWVQILAATRAISFDAYAKFLQKNFGKDDGGHGVSGSQPSCPPASFFTGTRTYNRIKEVTERFMRDRCIVGEPGSDDDEKAFLTEAIQEGTLRLRRAAQGDPLKTPFPNIEQVQKGLPLATEDLQTFLKCIDSTFRDVCLVELIWTYWHEEAMLVQTLKAISRRFQNRSAPNGRDPLANLEIDPLRPLNNLLWGYIQDEQYRLSVLRRAHEYEHHYGISLDGKAVTDVRPADRRSKFLESFHNLLYRSIQFYKQDDDKTVSADGFPVLNAIKETHYLVAAGAHNQFGDLPSTSRQEMLIEQWILGRPEMREFLRGRPMVPYPEPWMDRVDAMKSLQGWTDVSVVHFRDLGIFGEQLLLSIRHGSWARQNDPAAGMNWARFWRQEVQGYIHAYRATTGVDLTTEPTDSRFARERVLPPAVLLRKRLTAQGVR